MRALKRALFGLVGLLMLLSTPAFAQADFYQGKQLKIYIRAAPGGNYDLYGRLIVKYLALALPGRPTPVPVNMPGGSGMTALNYVAEVAPPDGLSLTLVTPSFPMDQALGLNKNLRVDMSGLNWIGNISTSNTYLLTSLISPTKSLDVAQARETLIGVPSTSDITAWMVTLLNRTRGTKFRLVPGYASGPEMNLAIQRGELEGRGTTNPDAIYGYEKPAGESFNVILQMGIKKDLAYSGAPLLTELAVSREQRVAYDFISKVAAISRPIAVARGVPAERVAALRRAFDAAVQDRDFAREAKQSNLEVSPMKGDEVQGIISEIVRTPPADLELVRAAIAAHGGDQTSSER
ncbi:MAG: tripartite tricarboxylate transporter family receptor [Hyphomicrobiales bacterium]|nr:tripartite tricarboxylate transporter family receptor [Hyphomicrobiales bacterium]